MNQHLLQPASATHESVFNLQRVVFEPATTRERTGRLRDLPRYRQASLDNGKAASRNKATGSRPSLYRHAGNYNDL